MSADPARLFRPGYRYAALAACCLVSAWWVANMHGAPDFLKAVEQADRDTQLPLERFAVDVGQPNALPLSPESQPPSRLAASEPLAAYCSVPLPRNAETTRHTGVTRRGGRHVAPSPYPTFRNWKNWT